MNVANLKKMTRQKKDRPSTMGLKQSRRIDIDSAGGTLRLHEETPKKSEFVS